MIEEKNRSCIGFTAKTKKFKYVDQTFTSQEEEKPESLVLFKKITPAGSEEYIVITFKTATQTQIREVKHKHNTKEPIRTGEILLPIKFSNQPIQASNPTLKHCYCDLLPKSPNIHSLDFFIHYFLLFLMSNDEYYSVKIHKNGGKFCLAGGKIRRKIKTLGMFSLRIRRIASLG